MKIFIQKLVTKLMPIKVIVILALFLSIASSLSAQLSPGDLSNSHSDLEGLSNCTNCHELGKGLSNKKCLECHTALNRTINAEHGYHFNILSSEDKQCIDCHRDHAGKEFSLIKWPKTQETFDHSLTGYKLEGGHTKVFCRDCHNPVLQQDPLMKEEASVDVTVTFLGLEENCLNCHLDEHRDQLGKDCFKCHGIKGFKPVEKFDHANAKYLLTGKHKTADCLKCHPVILTNPIGPRADTSYSKFTGLKYDNCLSCHKDKHDNKFGKSCDKCHNTTGWKNIVTAGFDHSRADFKLIAKHTKVACDKCHKNNNYLEKLAFDACTDCHNDSHEGQFARRDDKGKCESCHHVEGFKPALFTTGDHKKTRFELVGAHLSQPCVVCHKFPDTVTNKTVSRIFTFKDRDCKSCHQDTHLGQFASSKPIKNCTDCHNAIRWELPDFDHKQNTNYKLEGAHLTVTCSGCHKKNDNEPDRVLYRNSPSQCKDCHVNSEQLPSLMEGRI